MYSVSLLFPTLRSPPRGKRRLLRALHPGLLVLRVPDPLQHRPGAGLLRRLHLGSLLLLLRGRRGRRLPLPLRHGLRHHGRLLRVVGLFGDLHGMLWHLFSFVNIYLPFVLKLESVLKFPFKEGKKAHGRIS